MSHSQPPSGPFGGPSPDGPPEGPGGGWAGGPASGPPGGAKSAAVLYRERVRRGRRGVLTTVVGLVLLGICGLLIFGLYLAQFGVVGVTVGTLGALLPVGPVVAAFLWLDRWEPEPPRMLLIAFLWGACFATLVALIFNSSAEAAVALAYGDDTGSTISAVFVAPWVEEALKGSFLLGLLLFRRREFDGVLDGVVYAGVVGAGFAFTENILYLGRAFADGVAGGGGEVLSVLILRGVISPFAHPLFTAMTGIALGIATNARHLIVRLLLPVLGYLLAVLLHGLWNASGLLGGAGLIGIYVMIMLPIFFFVVAVVLYQRRREQRIISAELPGFAAAGWIAPSEVGLLQSLAGRSGWLRAVRRRSGPEVARMVEQYQSAVTELAILRHRMARGSLGTHARQWHDELLEEVLVSRALAVGSPDALHAAWGRRTPPPGWLPPSPPAPGDRDWPGQGHRHAAAPGHPPFGSPGLPEQDPPPRYRPPPGRPTQPGAGDRPPVPPPRQGPLA